MNSKILFLAVIAAVFSSCSSLKPLEFRSVENFRVSQITSNPQLSFDLKLYNPNTVGAKLKNLNIGFLISEIQLTDLHLDDVIHAGARSEFSVPINISASIAQLSQFLPTGIDLFNSGKSIPVKMDGNVTVKKFIFRRTFPFHFEQMIDTKQFGGFK
jgi:LEA14-like dessication related protein